MTRFGRQILLGWLAVLLLLGLSACDGPPRVQQICWEWEGTVVTREVMDGTGRVVGYCVFEDGTACHLRQLNYGTCTPPGATAPLSPIPTPRSWGSGGGPFRSGFDDLAPPPSLDALIDKAALIFFGEVGPMEQTLEMVTYREVPQPPTPSKGPTIEPLPEVMEYPATDFRLEVEEVLRDDGSIAAGDPIILRVLGHVTADLKESSQAGFYPVTYTGDRYLFLLTPYPDGETYGFYYGPWSRLLLDGDLLFASTGPPEPLRFAEVGGLLTLDEFVQAVTDADRNATGTPTPTP